MAGQPSTVVLPPCPPIVGVHEHPAGFSETKMAAHDLLALIVAVPLPVVPVPDFIAHAPPKPFVSWLVTNDWFRAPGDVVVNELKVASFCVAANIKTASLAKLVVIAGAVAVVAFAVDTP